MKKKIVSVLVSLAIVLSLVGCHDSWGPSINSAESLLIVMEKYETHDVKPFRDDQFRYVVRKKDGSVLIVDCKDSSNDVSAEYPCFGPLK